MATNSDWHGRFDSYADDDPEATKAALRGDAARIAGDWQRVGDDIRRAMGQAKVPPLPGSSLLGFHGDPGTLLLIDSGSGSPERWVVGETFTVDGAVHTRLLPPRESWWRRAVRKAKPWRNR